jgi:hypothetical protein
MKMTRHSKVFLGLALVFLMAQAGPVCAQPTQSFTGVIKEIAKATSLGVGKTDTFFVVKLDNYPETQFRLPPDEAVRSGLIDQTAASGVLTPQKSKGLGWKVKLTCDKRYEGPRTAPIYKVLSVERVNGKD